MHFQNEEGTYMDCLKICSCLDIKTQYMCSYINNRSVNKSRIRFTILTHILLQRRFISRFKGVCWYQREIASSCYSSCLLSVLVHTVFACPLLRWRCVHQLVWGLWGTECPSWSWICGAEEHLHLSGQCSHSLPHQHEWYPTSVPMVNLVEPGRRGPGYIKVHAHNTVTVMCLWIKTFCRM